MRGRTARELTDDIERRVVDGLLAPGDRLPSVRQLADDLDLAPNTVASAYRMLGDRGVVVGRGRRGTFIAERPPLVLADRPATPVPRGVRDLASGNPDPALLPPLRDALAAAAAGPGARYGDDPVDAGLAALALDGFRDDGVAAERVAVVGGALDGIERVLSARLRPGDAVLVEDPGYSAVVDLVGALGLRPVAVPVDDDGLDPGRFEALAGSAAALVHTPRAQNPTGAALSAERREVLRGVLDRHPDLLVVEDDHASWVAGAPFVGLAEPGRRSWAVVRSVAKALGPDLRLAMLAADRTTIDRVEGRQRLGTGWVPHVLQRAVATLLRDDDVLALLRQASVTYAARRAAVTGALAGRAIGAHGRSGFNVWVPVRAEQPVVEAMAARGWAIAAGERYRMVAPPAIRVCVAALDLAEGARCAAHLVEVLDPGGPTRSRAG
ncbi:MAG: aminotransferase class I/II-fold pyridoxal phosphate-dependent enzyme [Actinomycetota bacterium]|nr:aminotransferase class I/II-fold pyridoxal phosphate-dependent enzyme [Actinomycetota bacterium]